MLWQVLQKPGVEVASAKMKRVTITKAIKMVVIIRRSLRGIFIMVLITNAIALNGSVNTAQKLLNKV